MIITIVIYCFFIVFWVIINFIFMKLSLAEIKRTWNNHVYLETMRREHER